MKSSNVQSVGCIILSISTSRGSIMLDGASGEASARRGVSTVGGVSTVDLEWTGRDRGSSMEFIGAVLGIGSVRVKPQGGRPGGRQGCRCGEDCRCGVSVVAGPVKPMTWSMKWPARYAGPVPLSCLLTEISRGRTGCNDGSPEKAVCGVWRCRRDEPVSTCLSGLVSTGSDLDSSMAVCSCIAVRWISARRLL